MPKKTFILDDLPTDTGSGFRRETRLRLSRAHAAKMNVTWGKMNKIHILDGR